MPGHDAYTPLVQYLQGLPAEQRLVTLTFDEIKHLLGVPLVLTARVTTHYWSASLTARRNWGAAGWTAQLNRRAKSVTFTRGAT